MRGRAPKLPIRVRIKVRVRVRVRVRLREGKRREWHASGRWCYDSCTSSKR